ncbi:MAG: hypothetical protein AUJ39_00685 [Parcubacteria group bacterium CG1_02_42_13]|nr:MAG: hypothetical protein AUJ39_00685 [Parcubacteria group bacterium CG1_02_42_13]
MHRFLRQLLYGLFYLSVVAVFAGGIYHFFFISEPTCFDNIQNQNETGTDCGGSCIDCEFKTLTLKISEPLVFEAGQFKSTILTEITNPSINYGLNDFEYEFQIFSSFGTILPQRPHGRSYILAGESKYIIVPGIDIDRSYIGKVVLNIPNQNWEPKTSLPNYNFRFGNVQTSQSQKSVQVSGMLKNDSSSGFPSVNLVGILFDKSGKIINASSTKVDNISAFSEIPFTIFYPPVNNIPEINFAATKVFYEIKR